MFSSILYPPGMEIPQPREKVPEFFEDIGLLPVMDRLRPYCGRMEPFYTPTKNKQVIAYRQEIGRDLEQLVLRQQFERLSRAMGSIARQLKSRQDELPYLSACRVVVLAGQYVSALQDFTRNLSFPLIHSAGLKELALYVRECLSRDDIARMRVEMMTIERQWGKMEHTLCFAHEKIFLAEDEETLTMDEAVRRQFSAFPTSATLNFNLPVPGGETDPAGDNGILVLLAGKYPDLFDRLMNFAQENRSFADERLLRAADELTFYLSWLDATDRLQRAGCPFCYPEILPSWSGSRLQQCFDAALAQKLVQDGDTPVFNDLSLQDGEHILVITGPNQGGKTTFARMLGQTMYLASLGLRVPGSSAAVHPVDWVYTHFLHMGEEGAAGLRLDLQRLKAITTHAGRDSLVLINEIFASVPSCDGLCLGQKMLTMLDRLGCLTVCVTFLPELSGYIAGTVSLKSTVGEDEKRTYRLERAAPDGCAHAMSLARSKGLSRQEILARMKS